MRATWEQDNKGTKDERSGEDEEIHYLSVLQVCMKDMEGNTGKTV